MKNAPSFWILIFITILASAFVFNPFHGSNEEFKRNISYVKTTPVPSLVSREDLVVQNVIDGDTLTDSRGLKIRLIGINAPEKNQPNFLVAKQKLEALVMGKKAQASFDVEKLDQYGRILAYLYVGDTFINSELLKSGVAILDTVPPDVSHVEELTAAQELARKNCSGMWKDLCLAPSACIQISSIHSKTSGDLNNQYVELKNTCDTEQNLKGYLLKDSSSSNSYTFKDVKVAEKTVFRIFSGCGADTKTSLYWECPVRKTGIWNSDTDHAYLYNSKGILISDKGY